MVDQTKCVKITHCEANGNRSVEVHAKADPGNYEDFVHYIYQEKPSEYSCPVGKYVKVVYSLCEDSLCFASSMDLVTDRNYINEHCS